MVREPIKFVLINPTSPKWRVNPNQKPRNSSFFRFSMLPSLYVTAAMPSHVKTQIVDEDVEPVDFETDADIIGISFMTYNAPRAYEIGDIFRAKGKTVIFGGYHPSFMPEEAIQHADSICIGEAENNVPKMIIDYQNGGLRKFYRNELADLSKLTLPDRKLLKTKSYVTTNTLQATRGCFHHCEFCSVAAFNRYKIRTRPVGKVIEELKTLGKYVLFMDDNIVLNKEYAKELLKAMIPLKKKWFSQCGIGITEDDELLKLAAKSGCRGLFIGFESLSEQTLKAFGKNCNRKKDYLELVKKIHDAGIAICGGFVFGSDEDQPDVFENTLEFLMESNMDVLQSTRLTPFPGTPLFNRLDKEGRIFDKNWSHYDFFHVVYRPKHMDVETLDKGLAWLQKHFYSYGSILQRITKSFNYLAPEIISKVVLPLNFGWRYKLSKYGAFKLGKSFQKNPQISLAKGQH